MSSYVPGEDDRVSTQAKNISSAPWRSCVAMLLNEGVSADLDVESFIRLQRLVGDQLTCNR